MQMIIAGCILPVDLVLEAHERLAKRFRQYGLRGVELDEAISEALRDVIERALSD